MDKATSHHPHCKISPLIVPSPTEAPLLISTIKMVAMEHDYNHIVFLTKDLAGNQVYYFDTALEVGQEWQITTYWGICVSPSDIIYLMDASQEWHDVKPNAYFLPLLLNKMQLINNQNQKQSA